MGENAARQRGWLLPWLHRCVVAMDSHMGSTVEATTSNSPRPPSQSPQFSEEDHLIGRSTSDKHGLVCHTLDTLAKNEKSPSNGFRKGSGRWHRTPRSCVARRSQRRTSHSAKATTAPAPRPSYVTQPTHPPPSSVALVICRSGEVNASFQPRSLLP